MPHHRLQYAKVAFYDISMSQALSQDLARRLVHGLTAVQRRVEARAARPLRSNNGLDLDVFVLLETIANTDLAPGEIADALRLPAHGISRRLAVLEKAGLIERHLDPNDARRRSLRLTQRGRLALGEAQQQLAQALSPLFDELGGDERVAALLDGLTMLAAGSDEA